MSQAPGEARGGHAPVKLGVATLTAMVVGSMVGAGVFSLPATFAAETGVLGALIAWVIAGLGMLMLAMTFQRLAVRRPQLDAGVYAYAKSGFGELIGFFAAFGYWASACVGNVTYWVLIMSTLGAVVPALGAGDTLLAFGLSSVGLWVFFLLVRRGVREAASVNRIVTIAKLVPIVVAVVLALTVLDPAVFAANLLGGTDTGGLFDQVQGTMLITVFVFLGVEGASVYSRHARRRSDVGRATVLGFLAVFSVFASVTIVSFGVMPADELAALRQPSLAGVLEAAVGPWGAWLVSAGLIVAVLGAYLAWTLMAAEVVFVAAKDGDMPRFLARANDRDVPVGALLSSTVLAQVVLVVAMFAADAFDFALNLTSALALVPFLFAAGYLVRIGISPTDAAAPTPTGGSASDDLPASTGDLPVVDGRVPAEASVDRRTRSSDLVVGALATVYVLFLLFGAGWTYVLVSLIVQVPAVALFLAARHQRGRRLLSTREWAVLAVATAGAVIGLAGLVGGWIVL